VTMSDQTSPDLAVRPPARHRDAASRLRWVKRHLAWLFWVCAAVLAPWVVSLYLTQVKVAQAHQVRLLGVGLILAMMAGLLLTAWTYSRGHPRSVLAASFTAASAFICAWFRALTQAGASHWPGAVPVMLAVVAVVVVLCVTVIRDQLCARARSRWLPAALAIVAVALIPSLVVLLTMTPALQTAHHLKLAWTGLDVFEIVALASTGFALQRRPGIAAIPATVTGALLVCDAWLNIIPSIGWAFYEGIAMAFVELPLAALSFWVALHASNCTYRAAPVRGSEAAAA
jgi:hypothetical protein